MRRRPAVPRIGALGVAVLGVTGLGITGLTGCSGASSSGAAAQPPATGTATATAHGTAAATAAATPTKAVSRPPVDRYVPALLAVHGTFEASGGPVPAGKTSPPVMPVSGVITFRDSGGSALNVTVGPSGTFTVNLAPGSYTVTGRARNIDPLCYSPAPLTVRAGRPAHVTVVCSLS